MQVQVVHELAAETYVIHVTDEVVELYVPIADEVTTTDLTPYATSDAEVTTPALTEPSMNTDEEFSGGPIDRSMLIEYADQVTYRLWQREVYIFYI